MVEVGNRDGAVRIGSPTHRQVAARDQHEIAVQDAVRAHLAAAEDRGVVAMVGADLVQQLTHGEEFANGANK